jgi:GH24 family phage-related lysozyme (muramidase)
MKNVTKISIAIGSLALLWVTAYTGVHIPKNQTIDSLRIETAEARIREEEARKYREEREDAESQAIYLECFTQSTSQTGSRFDTQQREAYDCWRTKTNWTGKLAPSSEPPLWTIISNTTQNVSNKSTVWHHQTGTSWTGSKVQQAGKAQWKQLATTLQNWSKVSITQTVNKTWGTVTKGKGDDYWLAYETAIKLIRKWEGLRLKSYWDFSHCSIGYGFSYPCGKSITQKQADTMLSDRVHQDLKVIRSDFPKLDSEAQWALVSFKHNCPKGYSSVSKNWLKYFNSWCKSAGWKRLQGLVNRRSAEWKIISK